MLRHTLKAVILIVFLTTTSVLSACRYDAAPFRHPGLLHTKRDLVRIKNAVASGKEPWTSAVQVLTTNAHASLSWTPRAVPIVYRGASKAGEYSENYSKLYHDAAAAYALALRWHVSGEDAYADRAMQILNNWTTTLEKIDGSSDRYLAAGLYGYQLANSAELLRGYSNWTSEAFTAFVEMMLGVFYPMNHDFLTRHNGAKIDHYWANWDLANMASMISIGILADRTDIFDEAVEYFKNGTGNGAIAHAVWKIYPDGTGQVQESGRDQAHTTLVIGLLGTICQTAYNQKEDLFGYDNNHVLAGAEYVAKYNLGLDVNFTTYTNSDVTQPKISETARGGVRPVWELLYNHYVVTKKLTAPHISAWAQKVRPEGGGGNYGPNSGGFDQLGHGTLVFSRWDADSNATTR